MSQNPNEIVIAGGGAVYVAPVGTTMPTDVSASLNAAFVDVGLHTEDGVTFTDTPTTEEVRAWQSYHAVRRFTTAREATIAMQMEQWNAETWALYFGGGTVTEPTSDVFKYEPPEPGDAPYQRAMVIEFADGPERNYRVCIARAELQSATEIPLTKAGAALLGVTLAALAPASGPTWFMLTDDLAFEPTGS